MKRLLAIGEALIDFIPEESGKEMKDVCGFQPKVGGAPANVCGAFVKLGGEGALITQLGEDPFGDKIVEELVQCGIDCTAVKRTKEANTSLAFVALKEDGNREFSFYRKPGADMLLRAEEVEETWFHDAYALHFCSVSLGNFPMKEAHRKAISYAQKAGALVSFDPNLRFALWEDHEALRRVILEFMPMAHILKISDEELEFITGKNEIKQALPELLKGNTRLVIYTKGSEGAECYTKQFCASADSQKVKAVDTTGAGDGFIGSFLHCLAADGITADGLETLSERQMETYLNFANRFCGISVTRHGAIASYPERAEMNARYQIDTKENKEFLKEICDGLFEFGHQFPSPGGSSYYLGNDGTPWKESNRETWITSRMVHVYCLASFLGHPGSEELIDAGLKGIREELRDKVYGGWYAGLTASGEIMPMKQCYAHAFVILAASSAALAGRPGAKELLADALETYDRWFWNEEEGLSCDTWNTEFTKLDDYRGMNANMHTVEAFLAAADVTGDETYRVRAGRIIEHVAAWAGENNWRIPEHFSSSWQPDLECNKDKLDDRFKPYGATPGHGIEWARLIVQWAASTFKEEKERLKHYVVTAENLFNRAVQDGWNADGARGIVYTTDWNGNPIVHDRMHWTLAEAINTSAVLYRMTGNQKYADRYAEFLQYLDEVVLDHKYGSWFHQLDRKNQLLETVWPGKRDLYHAVQAMLIPYYDPACSIAAAVKHQN